MMDTKPTPESKYWNPEEPPKQRKSQFSRCGIDVKHFRDLAGPIAMSQWQSLGSLETSTFVTREPGGFSPQINLPNMTFPVLISAKLQVIVRS
jgi:hypothetical protein